MVFNQAEIHCKLFKLNCLQNKKTNFTEFILYKILEEKDISTKFKATKCLFTLYFHLSRVYAHCIRSKSALLNYRT